MFKKLLVTLLFTSVCLYAADLSEVQDAEHKSGKCKSFQNLKVCNTLNVGGGLNVAGNAVVRGVITAASFATPAGPISTGGDLSYAYSSIKDSAGGVNINKGDLVIFTSATSSSSITLDPITGIFTVGNTGVYKVQFQVRGTNQTDVDPFFMQLIQNGTTNLGIFYSDDLSSFATNLLVTSANGSIIVPLVAGDTLSIQNASGATVTLGEMNDLTGTVDAFILIEQIA